MQEFLICIKEIMGDKKIGSLTCFKMLLSSVKKRKSHTLEYGKNMASNSWKAYSLSVCTFLDSQLQNQISRRWHLSTNALQMPHEVLGHLKPQNNISYLRAFLQPEIKQTN